MKKIFTFLIILFSSYSFAQRVTISEPISVKTDDQYEIIGKLKGQYLIFQDKGSDFSVKAFDSQLRSKWEQEVELEKRRTKVLGIVSSKEDFCVIYSHRKKRKLNIRLGRFDPAATLRDSVLIKVYDDLFLTPNFQTIFSEDKKTVLIYYIKEQRTIEALAYSLESMKILWEKTIKPEDMAYYESFDQLVISNKGDLFIILEKDNKKHKREKHRYEIHQIDAAYNELTQFTIPMQGRLTYDIYFSYDNKNNRLIAGGLYSNKNRGRANGHFFMSISPNDPAAHQLHFEVFDQQLASNLSGKRVDVDKGIADTDVQEIVHRSDGGILLIAERNRHLERGTTTGRVGYGGRAIVDYYYDDVFVVSINPDGKTHWKNVLHKKQYSHDDDALYSSFFLLKTPSSLRFIFNDEIKLESTVSEYVINGRGDADRNSILNTDDQKIQLRFADAVQVAANELIVPSLIRSKLKFIRVLY